MILNTPTAWRPAAQLILAVLLLALPLKPPSAAGDIRAAVASVTKLSGTMPASGGVIGGPRISPDGLYAIYRADPETDETYDLWSVPLDGSLRRCVSRPA